MAEVTQYTHVSQEDQLKAIASCSLMFQRKGENREWFMHQDLREKSHQWQRMGLIWFLSWPARVFLNKPQDMINSIHISKSEHFYLSQTLVLRQEKVRWPSRQTFPHLYSIRSQHCSRSHLWSPRSFKLWFQSQVPSGEKLAEKGW